MQTAEVSFRHGVPHNWKVTACRAVPRTVVTLLILCSSFRRDTGNIDRPSPDLASVPNAYNYQMNHFMSRSTS